jgi:hypothetical protein
VGVTRFVRSQVDPAVAELAIAVVDDWQGRGLGTALLHQLAARASEEGVKRFSASVLEGNRRMLDLLRDLADVEVLDRDRGVVERLMDLPAHRGWRGASTHRAYGSDWGNRHRAEEPCSEGRLIQADGALTRPVAASRASCSRSRTAHLASKDRGGVTSRLGSGLPIR